MKKKLFPAICACVFLFVLCCPKESIEAARSGLLLWYRTLVPTLFPVMVLSRILLDSNLAYYPARLAARPFSRFLAVSPYGFYALIIGFLCGCPMGAKVLSDLREKDRITEEEAVYLARFCNNISPAFLIHFLVLEHLRDERLTAPTLAILLGAPLLYGLFTNYGYQRKLAHVKKETVSFAPREGKKQAPATAINFAMVDACITDSILSITKLGGYVVLFAVSGAALSFLPLSSPTARALLNGITEVSVGIHSIAALSLPFQYKYLLLTAVSAFGGLCCAAQSSQMLARIHLPLRSYLAARLSIAAIAVLMAVCYVA